MQLVLSHGAIDPLMVHARLPQRLPATSQQSPDPARAIARQARDMQLNLFEQAAVVDFASTTAISPFGAPGSFYCHCRAHHTQNVTDHFHWSSSGSKGERAISFFDRPHSTASRRISFSMVFLPNSRCSSLISLMAAASSEAGTTVSPALTAVRLPPGTACANQTPGSRSLRVAWQRLIRKLQEPRSPGRWLFSLGARVFCDAPARSESRCGPRFA